MMLFVFKIIASSQDLKAYTI